MFIQSDVVVGGCGADPNDFAAIGIWLEHTP